MITRALFFPKGTFDGFVVSDPLYGPDVKYRFSRKVLPSCQYDTGVLVFYNIRKQVVEGYDTISLDLVIVRQLSSSPFDFVVRLNEDGSFTTGCPSFQKGRTSVTEIGVDTASIYIGSQAAFKDGGESACIHTGGDGFLGVVNDLVVTEADWDRYRAYVAHKFHRPLSPEFPLGGKSSWFASHVSLDFDGSLLSAEYIDSMIYSNFEYKVTPVALPATLSENWLRLGEFWKQAVPGKKG